MFKRRILSLILTLPAILALFFVAGTAQESFKEIGSRVTEFTLNNGMKFIVLERHQAPVATFYTHADVGSVQEVKGITGLAHIFEHIAFKGTQKIGATDYAAERPVLDKVDKAFYALRDEKLKGTKADPGRLKQLQEDFDKAQEEADKYVVTNEYPEAIERAGGRDLNAATTWDSTIYTFSVPSNEAELWFYLESERFLNPVFREFYKERDVVMVERRLRTESQPIGKLIEEFLSVAYKAHPYGEPVVGHMSDLENITRQDAEAFFKKYYIPSNLTSVIVGNVDPARMRQMAETYFSRIPSGPKPEPVRTVEPPQEGERRVSLRLQSQRILLIGYHKPDINHPDNAVYEAISSLLSDGRSSRLYRALVRDKKIATGAGGFTGLPGYKYPSLFLFYATASPGHTNAECEKAIDEEILRLKTELVSKEELDGVKRRARAQLIRQLSDNSGMAALMARWQVMTGDWRNLFNQLDKIEAITPEDIKRVSNSTFTFDNKSAGVIEPLETGQAK